MTNEQPALASAAERLTALQAQLQARQPEPVRLIETHISWVLLARETAYKLKKPLRLPFLDCSTLAARRQCCDEEIRLNRRLAPSIYLGVAEVRQGPQGPHFGSEGELLDVAVQMRRFADGSLWSEQLAAGRLLPRHIDAMAQRLADFHAAAAVAPADGPYGTQAVHQRTTQGLVDALDAWHAACAPAERGIDWPALRDWLLAQQQALATHFDQRRRAGFVREGHGDLHLANLLLLGDEPCAFDGIDFDAALRWIDVFEDLAFVLMDLLAHQADALAWRFLDAYLAASGDHAGLPALRFHLVERALVRAQVMQLAAGLRAAAPGACPADTYRRLAARLAQGADPRLAITHGLPGSGKSHAAQQLLEQSGAIRLRSDVERKRLAGLAALEASAGRAPGLYGPRFTARTYARLLELARLALGAGWPVVVDAAFLRRAERQPFAALAAELRLPWAVIDCRAPLALLHQRIARRQGLGQDPSEADGRVLDQLLAFDEALDPAEAAAALVVDAEGSDPSAGLAQRWLALRGRTPAQRE